MGLAPGDLVTFARGELLRQIEGAGERIWLASPFLSNSIATYIARAAANSSAADRRLMTALTPDSVRVGVLDPKALLTLKDADFEITSRGNLHAKVSIADSSWGLVGSGNLTNAGLGSTDRGNAELGVVLGSEQIVEAAKVFDGWWGQAKPVSRSLIATYDALERIPRSPGMTPYGPPVEAPQIDQLIEILAENPETAHSRRYWLKSAYHDPADPDWWHRGWINDSAPLPQFQKDDLIVIYLGARNHGPQLCPAVVRAATESRLDRDYVIEHRDPGAADQWPYVTETTFVADVPLADGAPLALVDKTGSSLRRGNCSITREEFEKLARAMCAQV
jgi:hypothetical protein